MQRVSNGGSRPSDRGGGGGGRAIIQTLRWGGGLQKIFGGGPLGLSFVEKQDPPPSWIRHWLVVAYRRLQPKRIEPEGVSSKKRSVHFYFWEEN